MTAQKTAAKTKVSITGRDRSVELCTGLFINNEFVDGHGEAIISVNPADQSTLAVVHSIWPSRLQDKPQIRHGELIHQQPSVQL
ncbi:hypothetical protein MJO28_004955 [Puccinia striiformis f. sp. tritici]|uniref:Uncharacterized protein n=1 Tax=Puccinia striiformis f. sp. tritici TaxID=168172 RepID=A0ACC0EJV1_9BASI|nr:hypothetical protein MJO28_004955 [Puccinia striiformis f. sp. tritici]